MADSLKDLQAEKDRLHGTAFNGISVMLDSVKLCLRIKDSRSTERAGHPGDLNQALLMHGYTVGSWHEYSVAQSQATFTS
jgi:hypothetical protein